MPTDKSASGVGAATAQAAPSLVDQLFKEGSRVKWSSRGLANGAAPGLVGNKRAIEMRGTVIRIQRSTFTDPETGRDVNLVLLQWDGQRSNSAIHPKFLALVGASQ